MTPSSPLRSVTSGLLALVAAGGLLIGATAALADENPQAPLSSSRQVPGEFAARSDGVQQTAPAAGTYSNAPVGGEDLAPGQRIVSTRDGYSFRMPSDGNAMTDDSQGRAV
ncbi:hypothetical protein [Rathayibacter tanaceti]|uniref:Uncharacterized protein n=2 Tax=Rathayibacter tanaceti TaxID=1671680 RepID=A0A162FMS1_9MICO|nr:hypothetical protein [Rathayibacter tanaceti]KZX19715.1 hypothetical protein ACH61_03187 [Rathayibacter tanaceti]QHC55746.1 hypothetical protein GSU10_08960 [Rathayibacter tanaceti]TCO39440.1 hypothetical protein EV639_101386 [Rathayibacter tanaceti]